MPGALYHVILRGNAGYPLFLDDRGREHFYDLVGQGVERFGHRLHAFCLMTNHVHLLIQVGEIPLTRVIHNLTLRYTAWLNRRHNRIGHLFHDVTRHYLSMQTTTCWNWCGTFI